MTSCCCVVVVVDNIIGMSCLTLPLMSSQLCKMKDEPESLLKVQQTLKEYPLVVKYCTVQYQVRHDISDALLVGRHIPSQNV